LQDSITFRSRLGLGGLAASGVVLSHWLAYFAAAPEPKRREALLQATGHQYFTFVVALAFGLTVAGLLGFVADRLRHRGAGEPLARLFIHTAPRLAVLQVSAFVALESAERALGQGSIEGLLVDPVFLVGVAIQALTALAAGLFLVLFARTVEIISSLLRPTHDGESSKPHTVSSQAVPQPTEIQGPRTVRGPPLRPSITLN
jgi:hypothetical protein